MITLSQYFTNPTTGEPKPHTDAHEAAAADVLARREALREEFRADTGRGVAISPNTGTEISGSKTGAGDGGFRLHNANTGSPNSSHKQAMAVDDYDPDDEFDSWIDQFEDGQGGNSKLEQHGLYREAPSATPGWCHITTRRPGSGKRTFNP